MMIRKNISERFKTSNHKFVKNLYYTLRKLKNTWYSSNLLNSFRRFSNNVLIKIKYKLLYKEKNQLFLHLGCGGQHLKGFINIDWRKTDATDLVFDIRRLPYPDNSVLRIENYHLIEHLPRNDLLRTLREWYRVLVPGGKLVIECPDFDTVVREYIDGNDERLNNIFGLQRFSGDVHYFGYNFERLEKILRETGFKEIESKPPQDYHVKDEPCFRIESIK